MYISLRLEERTVIDDARLPAYMHEHLHVEHDRFGSSPNSHEC